MKAKVFSKFIDYHDDYKVDVEVKIKDAPNGVIKGLLTFGGGQSATLSTKELFDYKYLKDATTIRCHCDSFYYLLVNCNFNGFGYRSEYLIRSSTKAKKEFKTINVLLKGFTEWVIGSKSISWSDDGSAFSYTRENKRFNLDIENYDGIKLRISSDYRMDSPNRIAGLEVKEYCVISIENLSGTFAPEKVKDVVMGVRRVFSILTAFPLDIQIIYDSSERNDKSIYFAATQSSSKPVDYYHKTLYRYDYLFSTAGINTALNNYFSKDKKKFDAAWGRLYGLLDYRGFWENKLLLAVSLLDKASSDRAKQVSKDVRENSPFKTMRKELYSILDKYALECDSKHEEIFKNLKEQISSVKYQKLYSFEQKYGYLMQFIGPEISEVIDLSENGFTILKKLRNFLAHGDSPPNDNRKDISAEMILVNKVTLLLFYLAQKDLGFRDSEFLGMLQSSMSAIVQGAEVNQTVLKASTLTAIPVKVSKTTMGQLSASKAHNLVLRYSAKTGNYIFERDLSKKLNVGFFSKSEAGKGKINSIQELLFSFCDPQLINTISYVSPVIFITDQTRQLFQKSILLINAPIDMFGNYAAFIRTYRRDPLRNKLIS